MLTIDTEMRLARATAGDVFSSSTGPVVRRRTRETASAVFLVVASVELTIAAGVEIAAVDAAVGAVVVGAVVLVV